MRTRVPAALLLMLSWFLPAAGPAQALHTVTAQEATQQGQQGGHPGARKSPLPPSTAQARAIAHEATGGTALLPAGEPRVSLTRTAAARPHGGGDFAAACHQTTPARAPPSSAAL